MIHALMNAFMNGMVDTSTGFAGVSKVVCSDAAGR
jgi:hypothetical protein